MNKSKTLAFLITVILITGAILHASDDSSKWQGTKDANGIEWFGYEDGWKKAKAENKHMFVDFTATWCVWCKRLEKGTFSDKKITEALNDEFIAVKVWDHSKDTIEIDGFRITEKDLIKEFKVRGYPALWFVSPKGARIGPAGGYVDAPTLLKYFDIIKTYQYDSTLDENGNPVEG